MLMFWLILWRSLLGGVCLKWSCWWQFGYRWLSSCLLHVTSSSHNRQNDVIEAEIKGSSFIVSSCALMPLTGLLNYGPTAKSQDQDRQSWEVPSPSRPLLPEFPALLASYWPQPCSYIMAASHKYLRKCYWLYVAWDQLESPALTQHESDKRRCQ